MGRWAWLKKSSHGTGKSGEFDRDWGIRVDGLAGRGRGRLTGQSSESERYLEGSLIGWASEGTSGTRSGERIRRGSRSGTGGQQPDRHHTHLLARGRLARSAVRAARTGDRFVATFCVPTNLSFRPGRGPGRSLPGTLPAVGAGDGPGSLDRPMPTKLSSPGCDPTKLSVEGKVRSRSLRAKRAASRMASRLLVCLDP
jgi:hypothetical protein